MPGACVATPTLLPNFEFISTVFGNILNPREVDNIQSSLRQDHVSVIGTTPGWSVHADQRIFCFSACEEWKSMAIATHIRQGMYRVVVTFDMK